MALLFSFQLFMGFVSLTRFVATAQTSSARQAAGARCEQPPSPFRVPGGVPPPPPKREAPFRALGDPLSGWGSLLPAGREPTPPRGAQSGPFC